MLQSVEILAGGRCAVRRAVRLECDVRAEGWDMAVPMEVRDLSEGGVWIDSDLALDAGTRLTLKFTPPRWKSRFPLYVKGEVVRADLAIASKYTSKPREPGIAVRFTTIQPWEREALAWALEGLPPPLPTHVRRGPRSEVVWVDAMLTWEGEGGDGLEVSSAIDLDDDEFFEFQPAGDMLTVGECPQEREAA